MKQQLMRGWVRWAFLGTVISAIAVTLMPEDAPAPAKKERSRTSSSANQAASSAVSGKPKSQGQEVEHVELERLAKLRSQLEAQAEVGNVFDATSWYVPPPPPPPPPPLPPPVPTAPPLPFTYLGRYESPQAQIIILLKGDRIYNVSVGEVIENTYLVEQVAAGTVYMTYLPLNIKQTLSTGETL